MEVHGVRVNVLLWAIVLLDCLYGYCDLVVHMEFVRDGLSF